jgi:transcriptional regulator with XRE-family HTH domain
MNPGSDKIQRITKAEYDRRRTALDQIYGTNAASAAAKRDQALAALFAESGWTQEELADKEGKTQGWISQRLKFAAFLAFITDGNNPPEIPPDLSERRFRGLYAETDPNDTDQSRFIAVQLKLEAGSKPQRKPWKGNTSQQLREENKRLKSRVAELEAQLQRQPHYANGIDRDRLAKILGQLGSDQQGVVSNAIDQVLNMLNKKNVTWFDILGV